MVKTILRILFRTDDETTPPGTPPPPYKIKTKSTSDAKHAIIPKRTYFHPTNTQSSDSVSNNPISHNLSEHEDFMANDSIFNTSTNSAVSFGGNSSLQRQIISMEDDELGEDQELISGKILRIGVEPTVLAYGALSKISKSF